MILTFSLKKTLYSYLSHLKYMTLPLILVQHFVQITNFQVCFAMKKSKRERLKKYFLFSYKSWTKVWEALK